LRTFRYKCFLSILVTQNLHRQYFSRLIFESLKICYEALTRVSAGSMCRCYCMELGYCKMSENQVLDMQRGLATRKLHVRLSVRLSVCLSNTWFVTKQKSFAHIIIPYERTFILVLETRRMVGRGRLLPEILGQSDPVGAKKPIFNRFACSASAVTHSEKSSINCH